MGELAVVKISQPTFEHEQLTGQIIACALAVHRFLGPGLLESVYAECLGFELEDAALKYAREVAVPIEYKGRVLKDSHRIDVVVENVVVVELKACETLLPVHSAQTLTYMKLAKLPVGLLINFNERLLKDGLRRLYLP